MTFGRGWILIGAVLLLLLVGVVVRYISFSEVPGEPTRLAVATPVASPQLPDIEIRRLDDSPARLAEFLERPLVVTIWASWSPFAAQQLADLVALQAEEGERIRVVAVNRGESLEIVRNTLEEQQVSDDSLLLLADTRSELSQALEMVSMPETLIVGTDGTILFHQRGPATLPLLRRLVDESLE